jgi:PAS domain S-box-containing protein
MTEDAAKATPVSPWSRRVLDAAMDAVIMIDGQGRVVYWNPAAALMFGYRWEEVAWRDMAELIIPARLRDPHRQAFSHSDLGRTGSILGRRIEVTGQRADGSQFPVELTITRTDDGPTALFTGYLRDITDRQRLIAKLRDSRTRLLEVSDTTRREVERDLHDGAQQQLVGVAMVVARARATLAENSTAAAALLDQASDVLVAAITEIRELAQGVLPRVLTDHGLAPALAQLGRRSPIPVHLDTIPDRWAPTVETTLYFIAAESLTNAAKHGARKARLRVHTERQTEPGTFHDGPGTDVVVCTVVDDGPGGADTGRGTGLRGLEDRIAAVGGTLTLASPPGRGTTLIARIPIDVPRQDL